MVLRALEALRSHDPLDPLRRAQRRASAEGGQAWAEVAMLARQAGQLERAHMAAIRACRFDPGGRYVRSLIRPTWSGDPLDARRGQTTLAGPQRLESAPRWVQERIAPREHAVDVGRGLLAVDLPGRVVVLDVLTGEGLWYVSNLEPRAVVEGSLVAVASTPYLGTHLAVLDPTSGQVTRRLDLELPHGGPSKIANTRVVPCGRNELLLVKQRRAWRLPAELRLIDLAAATTLWSVEVPWVEAVAVTETLVCAEVGRPSGRTDVVAWTVDGVEAWRRPGVMLRCATPGRLLVGTDGRRPMLQLLDEREGRQVAEGVGEDLVDVFATSGAFVFLYDDVLVARDAGTLDQLWTVPAVRSRVTATSDSVVVADLVDEGVRVRVLGAADGRERSRALVQGWRHVDGIALVAGHVLVFEAPVGRLAAIAEDLE